MESGRAVEGGRGQDKRRTAEDDVHALCPMHSISWLLMKASQEFRCARLRASGCGEEVAEVVVEVRQSDKAPVSERGVLFGLIAFEIK